MIITLIKSYIDIYEVAKNTALSVEETNKLLSALLPINELIAREDTDISYMMATFNTYEETVTWLKELLIKLQEENI